MTPTRDAVVVGAGPAGLACAVTMRTAGLDVMVLEKAGEVGAVWRRHYDRLHLHTDRNHTGLPGMPMPPDCPGLSVADADGLVPRKLRRPLSIKPVFNTKVLRLRRDSARWLATRHLMRFRRRSWWWRLALRTRRTVRPGRDRIFCSGAVVHSSNYRNPEAFSGRRVLVIGFGDSGGEIALDLANSGVDVTLAVRSPVQIIPRDLLGFPILSWAILYRRLPARLVDFINGPVLRLAVGDFEKLGLRRAAKGPRQMVEEDGRVPLIDIGTLAKIRDGAIKVRGGVDRFTANGVVFTDASTEEFEAVILATGFRPDLRRLVPDVVACSMTTACR